MTSKSRFVSAVTLTSMMTGKYDEAADFVRFMTGIKTWETKERFHLSATIVAEYLEQELYPGLREVAAAGSPRGLATSYFGYRGQQGDVDLDKVAKITKMRKSVYLRLALTMSR